jgi:hypothetical protein
VHNAFKSVSFAVGLDSKSKVRRFARIGVATLVAATPHNAGLRWETQERVDLKGEWPAFGEGDRPLPRTPRGAFCLW